MHQMKTFLNFKKYLITTMTFIIILLMSHYTLAIDLTCNINGTSSSCGSSSSPIEIKAGDRIALIYTSCPYTDIDWTIDSTAPSEISFSSKGIEDCSTLYATVPSIDSDQTSYVEVNCDNVSLLKRVFYYKILGNDLEVFAEADKTRLATGEKATVTVDFSVPATAKLFVNDVLDQTDNFLETSVTSQTDTTLEIEVTGLEVGTHTLHIYATDDETNRHHAYTTIEFTITTPTIESEDSDGDGYTDNVDCDDTNPDIHPDAEELCDSIDNNCDGTVDEDCPTETEICDDSIDNDGDGIIDCDDVDDCADNEACSTIDDGSGDDTTDDTEDDSSTEICNDEIDNNGDDLIDCEDPECADFIVNADSETDTPITCAEYNLTLDLGDATGGSGCQLMAQHKQNSNNFPSVLFVLMGLIFLSLYRIQKKSY